MNERDIFTAARQLQDAAERDAFLDEACAGDQELRCRVVALLEEQAQLGSFLEHSNPPAVTVDDAITERTGTVIGPYKLLEQIGEGGMGTVWMGQQTEPVKRLVAIKLIKAGMDSKQVIARFEAERQALALMDHPNIARVLDGGTTGAGRPYFVMDLVKGVPITGYCDEHRLTPRQRLELFVPVCQAVQHAHQKGIIHRDLKPSNVLVALYDGKPVPKVIDFGVAKATGQQLTEQTLVTGFGALVGTLEYMSPEQAEVNNQDIDTRSDIYALGVLLYELLTGSTPFSRKELTQAGMLEMLRVIREQEPSKPSTKLSTAEGLPTLAANRGTEPAKLTRLVRGELDWIVMKALEKDRNRRYETANGFAMDVQRYLADEPVAAGPPSTTYRLLKFLRRNKKPVLAVSGIFLLLICGIIGTTWGMVRAEHHRQSAEAKEKVIRAERDEKARALAAETEARQGEKQARDQAMAALRAMTDDIVENQMARGTTLTEENKEFLRKVIKHFEGFAALSADDAESRLIRAEGHGRAGWMRFRLGELKEAESALAEALAIHKQLAAEFPARSEFHEALAQAHNHLGILFQTTGRLKEAEIAYSDALAIRKKLAADFPARPVLRHELADSRFNLGLVLQAAGRLREAEIAYGDALAIQKQLAADFPTRPEFRQGLASTQNSLAILSWRTGRLKEAEIAYSDALAIRKQLAADFPARPEFRRDLAVSHNNLAVLLRDTRRLKEAEMAYADALAVFKQLAADFPARPEFHQGLAMSHSNLGNLLRATGRLKEAETAQTDALTIRKQLAADFPARPEFRQDLAMSHNNLGNLLRDTGRLKEAETAYAHALTIRKQLTADFPNEPEFRYELAKSHYNLGNLLRDTGRFKEAETAYAHALAVFKQLAADNPTRPEFRQGQARSHHDLADTLCGMGRLKEAEAAFADALTIRKQLAADFPDQPDVRSELAHTLGMLAQLCNWRRDFKAGKAYLDDALAHHQAALEADTRNSVYRQGFKMHLSVLVHANAGLQDQATAVQAAQKLRDLGWDLPGDAYDAGCALAICIPVVQKDDRLDPAKRQAAAQFYGDQAMAMLRTAVANGYKDAAQIKKDTDLVALRDREDFRKLLAEVEAGLKKAKD
jgi:serine/threonine protein kinase/tetratricopeptide (TPR) repeat protein